HVQRVPLELPLLDLVEFLDLAEVAHPQPLTAAGRDPPPAVTSVRPVGAAAARRRAPAPPCADTHAPGGPGSGSGSPPAPPPPSPTPSAPRGPGRGFWKPARVRQPLVTASARTWAGVSRGPSSAGAAG